MAIPYIRRIENREDAETDRLTAAIQEQNGVIHQKLTSPNSVVLQDFNGQPVYPKTLVTNIIGLESLQYVKDPQDNKYGYTLNLNDYADKLLSYYQQYQMRSLTQSDGYVSVLPRNDNNKWDGTSDIDFEVKRHVLALKGRLVDVSR